MLLSSDRLIRRGGAVAVALALGVACTAAPPPCPKEPTTAASGAPASTSAPAKHAELQVTINADPAHGAVRVALEIDPALAGRAWSVASTEPGAVRDPRASDAGGELSVSLVPRAEGGVTFAFGRAVRGALHLEATFGAMPARGSGDAALFIDGDNLRARGGAVIPLPEGRPTDALDVELVIVPYAEARAASSFGVGTRRRFRASLQAIADALVLTGPLGDARFDTAEGHDEAAWTGYTAFDPRPIAADVAAFRTAVGEVFHAPARASMTLLIVTDSRPKGAFVVSRVAGGVVARLGVNEPWSGPVRIAVATAVVHGWIGDRLWIGPTDAAHEAEAYWFTEGVARAFARDLLVRFGLITPAELADEVHGLTSTALTSSRRSEGNVSLASHVKEPRVLPLLVARGALYATHVGAAIKKASGGKRSLEDLVRGLYAKAAEHKTPLPASAWTDAVRAELGDAAVATFTDAIERGIPPRLPDDALGVCFSGTSRRYQAFELGFDEAATRAGSPKTIAGLVTDGPAARAGLTSTDVLVEAVFAAGSPSTPAKLVVERDGARRTVQYLPAGASAEGRGFTRKRDVADEACAK